MPERATVHVINPLTNVYGGSEARTLATTKILRKFSDVKVWSENNFDPNLSKLETIRRVDPVRLKIPFLGTLLFVGTYFTVGSWLRFSRPKNIVIISNTAGDHYLDDFLRQILKYKTSCPISLAFASPYMQSRTKLPGKVLLSPIDIEELTATRPQKFMRNSGFTIGRLSRDVPEKHHPEDIKLYRQLASSGMKIRIMGGSQSLIELANVPGIELLEVGAEPVPDFLSTLDCFFYRTAPDWYEPHGRVITEAMATGLPIVAARNGGYAEHLIKESYTGFLIETNSEALAKITELQSNAQLRQEIGKNAQDLILAMNSDLESETANYIINPEACYDIRSLVKL